MTEGVWVTVAQGMLATIQLTVVGFIIGAFLGIPLLVLRISEVWVLRASARSFIEVARGVPLIIWLFLIYNGPTQFNPALGSVFTSWRSAVLAIGLISAAYMAEIYRGALRAINQGQFEASRALGVSRIDTASRIVGPQMVRVAIPASASYAITVSSNTSSVTPFFVAGAYYVALTLPSAWAARRLEIVAARLAIRRSASFAGAEAMVQRLESMGGDEPWAEATAADLGFHREVVRAAGSPRILRAFTAMSSELQLAVARSQEHYEDPQRIGREHRVILDALVGGDITVAENAIRYHLEDAVAELLTLFD